MTDNKEKPIVVAVDGSAASWVAFETALSLAKLMDRPVDALHVIQLVKATHRPLAVMLLPLAYIADSEGKPVPWNESRWVDEEFSTLLKQAQAAVVAAGIRSDSAFIDGNSIKLLFSSTDDQIKAKDVLQSQFGERQTVALNLLSASPQWLTSIRALPMYLGLDLRGGVHFLLQVDMQAAHERKLIGYQGDIRTELRSAKIRYSRISREGNNLVVKFSTRDQRDAAMDKIKSSIADLDLEGADGVDEFTIVATLNPQAEKKVQENAVKQNLQTLRNRVNELGVAEPVLQQQGVDRVVVQFWRAGHRQGQGHPRTHRHPGNPPGR